MKKNKVGIYMGRFQPLHLAHEANIREMLGMFDTVIVFIGSANKRQSAKNPFTYELRRKWVEDIDNSIIVRPLNDYDTVDEWANKLMDSLVDLPIEMQFKDVTLCGYHKDESSFYLDIFPIFEYHELTSVMPVLSATTIRKYLFSGMEMGEYPLILSETVNADLIEESKKDYMVDLATEWKFYEKEKELFASYPFPETLKFCCADAIVVWSDKILLVQRKYAPGKNTWAMPGGFVNQKETFEEAARRELLEEAGLDLLEYDAEVPVFSMLFDSPYRGSGQGIPRMTIAHMFVIDSDEYPNVLTTPSDDAAACTWVSLDGCHDLPMYSDHLDIITKMMKEF